MQRVLNDDGDEVAEADKADRVSGLGFAGYVTRKKGVGEGTST